MGDRHITNWRGHADLGILRAWGPGLGSPKRMRDLAGRGHCRDEKAALGRGVCLGPVGAGLEAPGPPSSARSPDGRPGAQEALEGLVGRRPRRLRPGTQHHGRSHHHHRQPPPPARSSVKRIPVRDVPQATEPTVATPSRRGKAGRQTGSCCCRTAIVDGQALTDSFSLSNRGLIRC